VQLGRGSVGFAAEEGMADAGGPHGVAGAGHVHPALAEEEREGVVQSQQVVARVEAAEDVVVEVERGHGHGHGRHGAVGIAQLERITPGPRSRI
jgi:hypothetical protein